MDEGSAKAVRVAFERLYRADLAYRTEALVNWCPGCRTSVSDLEVIADARDRDALVGALPPDRSGHRRAVAGRDHHHRDDPAGDDPRRHRGRGPPGRPALRGSSSGGWCASRSSSATSRSSPTTSSIRRSGPARSRSPRPTTTTTTRPACATACRRRPSWPTTRRSPRPGRATTGWTGSRRGRRSSPTSRRRGDLVATAPHEMVIGRCQRSNDVIEPRLKTQWFVRTDAARGAGARGDPQRPDADPPRAIREDLGALADQHPRLERLAPAVVGPSHPGLVLPGRARDGVVRGGRSRRLRGLRPPGRRPPAGPRHLRYVVQLRAVAVLDAGLAGRHARPPRPTTRHR